MKRSLFAELGRRNVLRAATLYAAGAWLLVQVVTQVGPVFNLPAETQRWIIVAAVIAFPFAMALSWFYELTPEGFKREGEVEVPETIRYSTGRKLDFAIIGVLSLAVVLLLTDRFVLRNDIDEQAATQASAPVPDRSIAVLPFVNLSSDKEQEYFSDGISEDLLNLLAKIPQLRVTARTSSFSFKRKDASIAQIAKTLHVAYLLKGSVRKTGDQVRITAQLIRASDGTQQWSNTYDSALDDVFKVQDRIAADVVNELQVKLLDGLPKSAPVDGKLYPLLLEARRPLIGGTLPIAPAPPSCTSRHWPYRRTNRRRGAAWRASTSCRPRTPKSTASTACARPGRPRTRRCRPIRTTHGRSPCSAGSRRISTTICRARRAISSARWRPIRAAFLRSTMRRTCSRSSDASTRRYRCSSTGRTATR